MRDIEIAASRIGGLQAHDTDVVRTVLRGCCLGYVNLRASTLVDVEFDRCSITDLDIGDATIRRPCRPPRHRRGRRGVTARGGVA